MSLRVPAIAVLLAWSACGPGDPSGPSFAELAWSPVDDDCHDGSLCAPWQVATFPYFHHGDTTALHEGLDFYGCAPDLDLSGPEAWFQVFVPTDGLLTATLDAGSLADLGVHLLDAEDPHACLARADDTLTWFVEPGVYFVVVDTRLDDQGDPLAGVFDLQLDFLDLEQGPCAVVPVDSRMWWPDCADGVDCFEADDHDGEPRVWLRTPAWGPVAKEAHLVTTEEFNAGGQAWPTATRDGIQAHYAVTEAASGYPMSRREPWAPSPIAGDVYARGSTGQPVPALDETWYVNMFWLDRPLPGTRMLAYNPVTGRAVVASGGYETGPRSNRSIGGASEEIHDWLGTHHKSPMVLAFLADQSLPLGPIDCGG